MLGKNIFKTSLKGETIISPKLASLCILSPHFVLQQPFNLFRTSFPFWRNVALRFIDKTPTQKSTD